MNGIFDETFSSVKDRSARLFHHGRAHFPALVFPDLCYLVRRCAKALEDPLCGININVRKEQWSLNEGANPGDIQLSTSAHLANTNSIWIFHCWIAPNNSGGSGHNVSYYFGANRLGTKITEGSGVGLRSRLVRLLWILGQLRIHRLNTSNLVGGWHRIYQGGL